MKKKNLDKILKIESILIELALDCERKDTDPEKKGWSSRLEAERIFDVIKGKSKEKIKKPWEHMAVKLPGEYHGEHTRGCKCHSCSE